MSDKKEYTRAVKFLTENGLLEPMIKAYQILRELNSLPIVAVARIKTR